MTQKRCASSKKQASLSARTAHDWRSHQRAGTRLRNRPEKACRCHPICALTKRRPGSSCGAVSNPEMPPGSGARGAAASKLSKALPPSRDRIWNHPARRDDECLAFSLAQCAEASRISAVPTFFVRTPRQGGEAALGAGRGRLAARAGAEQLDGLHAMPFLGFDRLGALRGGGG